MKNKKSQGLTLNTIVVAMLVLVLLVILVLIFTGRANVLTGLEKFDCNNCINQHTDEWDEECRENCECIEQEERGITDECYEIISNLPEKCWYQPKLPEDSIREINRSDPDCSELCKTKKWWCLKAVQKKTIDFCNNCKSDWKKKCNNLCKCNGTILTDLNINKERCQGDVIIL